MGCWNETCGVTQMPIEGGDPVRLFLIVKNRLPRDYEQEPAMSYNTELWRPFGLPIKGTYDEYGRIENIQKDILSDFLLERIREVVVEVPNRMGDVFKREELDWATAIDFLTDEGLKVTDPFHISNITKKLDETLARIKALIPDLPDDGWSSDRYKLADAQKKAVREDPQVLTMYHMMVHEDIYQAFMKYQVPSTRFSHYTEGDLKEDLYQAAEEYLNQTRIDLVSTKEMSELELLKHESLKRMLRLDNGNRFVSLTNHLNGSYGSGTYFTKYLDFIDSKIEAGAPNDDPAVRSIIDQFIEFAMFSQSMTLLRKMWMPQTGKGGQDREYVLFKYLAEVTREFSEKKIEDWEKKYGESEEDDEDAESERDEPEEPEGLAD